MNFGGQNKVCQADCTRNGHRGSMAKPILVGFGPKVAIYRFSRYLRPKLHQSAFRGVLSLQHHPLDDVLPYWSVISAVAPAFVLI